MSYPTRLRNQPSRGGSSTPLQQYGSTSSQGVNYGGPSDFSKNQEIILNLSASTSRPAYNTPSRGPPNGAAQAAAAPRVHRHPPTYDQGPLPYFLPPPGQVTLDPTLQTPPVTQALYSTYPSRMRTGVTNLIQPETVTGGPKEREYFLAELDREIANSRGGSGTSTPRVDSPGPLSTNFSLNPPTARRSAISGRRGKFVNYAEKESDDESEEELSEIEEPASDPEDGTFGERGRRRPTERSARREERGSGTPMMPPPLPSGPPMNPEQAQAAARAAKLRRKYAELEKGWTWLGDRTPGDRVRSVGVRATRHDYRSEEVLEREATRAEALIPISIDLDIPSTNPDLNGIKIKDRFLWNVNEPFITPHAFSSILCNDIGVSQDYATTIAELIQAQIEEAQAAVEIDIMDKDVTEDDVEWSEPEDEGADDEPMGEEITLEATLPALAAVGGDTAASTPAVATPVDGANGEAGGEDAGAEDEGDDQDDEVEEDVVEEKVWAEADCRIIINLEVQIFSHVLRDRIEWDLSSALPPADFARAYARDLGLTGEAVPLIACALHEEILKHKRDALDLRLFNHTHPDEQGKWEKVPGGGPRVNRRDGAKGLVGVWRDWWDREEFAPVLVELTLEEMERRELERTREARRMMRTLTGAKRRR